MPNYDEIINTRQSIRKYSRIIPDEIIVKKMLKAALHAPSPSNTQPVRFVLFDSLEARHHLKSSMEEGHEMLCNKAEALSENNVKIMNKINYYWRYSRFIFDAPLLFAAGIVQTSGSFSHTLQENSIALNKLNENSPMDISMGLSLGNFIYKAVECGLGTCILTAPLNFIANINSIPGLSDMKISAFITAGYPDESPIKTERFDIKSIYKKI